MQTTLMIAISFHLLGVVSWTSSTLAIARFGLPSIGRAFVAQCVAAAVVIGSGAYLMRALHGGAHGGAETLLFIGAVCGLFALIVQVGTMVPALLRMRRGPPATVGPLPVKGQRIAALLLAVAIVCMAISRFA